MIAFVRVVIREEGEVAGGDGLDADLEFQKVHADTRAELQRQGRGDFDPVPDHLGLHIGDRVQIADGGVLEGCNSDVFLRGKFHALVPGQPDRDLLAAVRLQVAGVGVFHLLRGVFAVKDLDQHLSGELEDDVCVFGFEVIVIVLFQQLRRVCLDQGRAALLRRPQHGPAGGDAQAQGDGGVNIDERAGGEAVSILAGQGAKQPRGQLLEFKAVCHRVVFQADHDGDAHRRGELHALQAAALHAVPVAALFPGVFQRRDVALLPDAFHQVSQLGKLRVRRGGDGGREVRHGFLLADAGAAEREAGDGDGDHDLVLVHQQRDIAHEAQGLHRQVHAVGGVHLGICAVVPGVLRLTAAHILEIRIGKVAGVGRRAAPDQLGAFGLQRLGGLGIGFHLVGGVLLLHHAEGHGGIGGEGAEIAVQVRLSGAVRLHSPALFMVDLCQRNVVPGQTVLDEDRLRVAEGIDQVALVLRRPGEGIAVLRVPGVFHGAAVPAQGNVHILDPVRLRAVHQMAVGGALSIAVHAGEHIAVALLFLGQGGVVLLVRHAGGQGREHLRPGVPALLRRGQAAGRHGVVDFQEVFRVFAVIQLNRLKGDLVVAGVPVQHLDKLIRRAGGDVEIASIGVIAPGDFSVPVPVQVQLHPAHRGGHDAALAEVVHRVIEKGQPGIGQVLHPQPDPVVALVQRAVVQDAVVGIAVEVDILRVLHRAQGVHRAFVLLLEGGGVKGFLLDLPGEVGRAALGLAVAHGDLVLAACAPAPEGVPALPDAGGVDGGGGLAVLVRHPGDGGGQVQAQGLDAVHHHVDGIGLVDIRLGHSVPDQGDRVHRAVALAALLDLRAVDDGTIVVGQVDGGAQDLAGVGPEAVHVVQRDVDLAAHIELAVIRYAAGVGDHRHLRLDAPIHAGVLLQGGRPIRRGDHVPVPALAVVGGVDAQAQVVAQRPSGQAGVIQIAGGVAVRVAVVLFDVQPQVMHILSGTPFRVDRAVGVLGPQIRREAQEARLPEIRLGVDAGKGLVVAVDAGPAVGPAPIVMPAGGELGGEGILAIEALVHLRHVGNGQLGRLAALARDLPAAAPGVAVAPTAAQVGGAARQIGVVPPVAAGVLAGEGDLPVVIGHQPGLVPVRFLRIKARDLAPEQVLLRHYDLLSGDHALVHGGGDFFRLHHVAGGVHRPGVVEQGGQVCRAAFAAVGQGNLGLRDSRRAESRAVAFESAQRDTEGTGFVACHAIVDQRHLNDRLVNPRVKGRCAAGFDVVLTGHGGAVLGGVVNRHHGLVAAGPLDGKERAALRLVRFIARLGEANGKSFRRFVVRDGEGQGRAGAVYRAAVVLHQGKGGELHRLRLGIIHRRDADFLDPFPVREGHREDIG